MVVVGEVTVVVGVPVVVAVAVVTIVVVVFATVGAAVGVPVVMGRNFPCSRANEISGLLEGTLLRRKRGS